ncbi:UNVERIFIED_CONTAM: hypothetical protein FKN15_028375 [Acipenser sinensis]
MEAILDYTVFDEDLFPADSDSETPLNTIRPVPGTSRQQIRSTVIPTLAFSATLAEKPSRSSSLIPARQVSGSRSQIIARSPVSEIKSWTNPKLQQQLRNKKKHLFQQFSSQSSALTALHKLPANKFQSLLQ